MTEHRFPPGFVWGVATAAYQIEGAVNEDGRGQSIWDTFSHTHGRVVDGDTGDVADDHYHRWQDDIKLMQELGIGAYRFSIAWPRILPHGAGKVNATGLEFYDRLVDALLAAKITPFVTLYHWDLPQALEDKGGWTNRQTADAFVAYAGVVAHKLGDRVKNWMTLNEPWVSAFIGYLEGHHAPGVTDLKAAVHASHNLLLAHGRAVPVLRAASPGCSVGMAFNLHATHPASDSAADKAAERQLDGYVNRWFLDPAFGRGYPADMMDLLGKHLQGQAAADMKEIGAPIDFIGVNYYFPAIVRAATRAESQLGFSQLTTAELKAKGHELTTMEWPVVPAGLHDLLMRLQRDYAPKAMYITENGCAYDDTLAGGKVEDPKRIAYLQGHLAASQQAIADGASLRGYFLWSFLDNFEWAMGYSKRFGIVYVDYATQKRIPKGSFAWYKKVIAANAV